MATAKFKALVHFIVHECRDHPHRLGAIRLNKTLWYTDVLSYKMHGLSVTGESYVKRKKGPVPAQILATLRELKDDGKILIQEPEFQYDVRKYISLANPNVETLSEDDRALARSILDAVCGYTANAVSEMTHDVIWDAAAEGEEIPLYATLASELGEVTEDVKTWAASMAAEVEAVAA
ncbi:hypothetical protein C7I87_19520 [Mesorhizobium sp. SARCC-RB16n]|uniref:Panacea domain-containing protein n=1 Tax=Mesorhizobium sp. SARCC-RB16n TaxID=2116687 RepID=UPI00122F8FA2|nr:Panacea domain-containing protein [Mesorhizobium sp. SARCC-RB16n]KAA3448862.1 hypothetical protein C7I87_19520 [Mesorhizobium sp. SARCC-RB16n]